MALCFVIETVFCRYSLSESTRRGVFRVSASSFCSAWRGSFELSKENFIEQLRATSSVQGGSLVAYIA